MIPGWAMTILQVKPVQINEYMAPTTCQAWWGFWGKDTQFLLRGASLPVKEQFTGSV